jgi:ABC transporter with metal-binding/Fe-S-binding domain ATP-binding protein
MHKIEKLRVAVLITGGKDSTLALHRAIEIGYDVKNLVTIRPKRSDSWMFHFPNIHLASLFAEAVEIPLVEAETEGIKELELEDLRKLLSTLEVDAIINGATSSRYQKERIDKICSELDLMSISPLWQLNPKKMLEEFIHLEFKAVIIGVYAMGFNKSWLGREINTSTLHDLLRLNQKYQVSLLGEGGEYETLVLDGPIFNKKIKLFQTEIIWNDNGGYLHVKEARLISK